MANDIGGVWRTIGGRRVFIKDGQDLASAMKESGKFKSKKDIEHQQRKINNELMGLTGKDKEIADEEYDAYEELKKDNYESKVYGSDVKKADEQMKKVFGDNFKYAEDIEKELNPSLKNASDERLEKEAKRLLEAPEGAVDEKTTFYTNEKGGLERSTSDLKKWRDDLTKKDSKEHQKKNSEIYFMDQELGVERPIPSREEWEKEWNSRGDREDYADTSYEGLINALEDNGTINREQTKQYLEKNSKTPLKEEEAERIARDKFNQKYGERFGDKTNDMFDYISTGKTKKGLSNTNSIVNAIKQNKMDYEDDGLGGTYSLGEWGKKGYYVQFQDRESHQHDDIMKYPNVSARVKSNTWARVWKDGELVQNIEDTKFGARQKVIDYFQKEGNSNYMNKGIRDAYEKYKNKHPNSKMTFTQFKDNNK